MKTIASQRRITISLKKDDFQFLHEMGKRTKIPKSRIMRTAMQLLRQKALEDDLRQGAITNAEQDLHIAEEGMSDWAELLKDYPNDFETKKR